MGLFSKKENYGYIITSRYFIIDDDLYRFQVRDFMSDSDCNLPTTELLNKYGFYVSKYNLKLAFKKKFDDFRLDGSLYSANFFMRGESQCFPTIVRPKRKLIDEGWHDVTSSLILEIEVLDGISAQTRNAFISFYDFLENYKLGHNMKVLVNGEASNVEKIEDYFDFV